MTLFMTSEFKNQFENDVITTDMISAWIHLLINFSLRHTHSFSFLDKSTGPILPYMFLALYFVVSFIPSN